ncbi:unnamed protein product (macronuclear) [Paramecium tetraurelia]|uniref:YjeF C-terminal domain-containing protein n=1 Tax=Paramecium tetraurelia TaxID=5888 RepID=A0DH39_PARTE|nr:uncharacterized protein GSPATT00016742001 [Paramecium tetraurelia]CAK82356.1 unnamed protein product [Paramecium tetraurelia]|eukprot:XP_001449753.1 hypothetical protein (macronuclear) [Paramecium tetraurelia strain d4-2]
MFKQYSFSKIIPLLDKTSHKGQNGKIASIGGSFKYTGAPYYAAISSLSSIQIMHSLVFGPGLGRQKINRKVLEQLFKQNNSIKILDIDALWHISQKQNKLIIMQKMEKWDMQFKWKNLKRDVEVRLIF